MQALAPCKAPALFNLRALEFETRLPDGRVEVDHSRRSGIRLPEAQHLERPLRLLAAQALMRMIAPEKMVGPRIGNQEADLLVGGPNYR
jgi:hypothetical protein